MKEFQLIMPVFQTKAIFLLCIKSLLETILYPTELIIINDGTGFDCISLIYENLKVPSLIKFQYIFHPVSAGCPKSINQGLAYIREDTYVAFIDSDIIFNANWQNTVIETLDDSNIGAVSGIFLYPQSEGIQCCGIAYQDYLARHVYLNNKEENLHLSPVFDVQASIFAFLAMKSNIIYETGFLDENFFNGYEDVDYQFRIRKNGYRIVTNTALKFYHFEKSNGIHRQFSRKQNLGLFWAKHASYVENDLQTYLEQQLKSTNISDKGYVLINMCEAHNDADKIIQFLKRLITLNSIIDVSALCNIETKLWIPELLSTDSYAIPRPYIFLCDNFIELSENAYWFHLRSKYSKEDFIIDLYANVIPFEYLKNQFWPGNKIR